MAAVSLKNVHKDFYSRAAVTNFNLEIPDNEIVALLGNVGSGKSTILRMIAGIEKVSAGEIYFDNILYNDIKLKKRNTAMVFKKTSLFNNKTLYKNLAYGLKLRKTDKQEIFKKINCAAGLLGIEALLDKKPKCLNDDFKQLTAIARAVIRKPGIILLDEPFSNADNSFLLDKLTALIKQFNATCVYATNNYNDAKYLNKKTVIIKDGIIEQCGDFENVYNKPLSKYVAEFTGGQINFFDGLIVKENETAYLQLLGKKQELKSCLVKLKHCDIYNKPLIIGIRPEDIKLNKSDDFQFAFSYKINYTDKSEKILLGNLENEAAIIKFDNYILETGQEINVYINPDKIHFFNKETELRLE